MKANRLTAELQRYKRSNTWILSSILATALSLTASSVAFGAKWGVVDMQAVIVNVEEGKEARASLEKEIKAKEKELQTKKSELDKLNEEWKKQAPLLSEDARLKKQQEFQEKFLTLRNNEMEFQANIKRKEQQATQGIAVKVAQVVESLAKNKKLEAVFETNSAGLLYLDEPVDLTKDVIAAYGKANKGSANKSATAKKDTAKKDTAKKDTAKKDTAETDRAKK